MNSSHLDVESHTNDANGAENATTITFSHSIRSMILSAPTALAEVGRARQSMQCVVHISTLVTDISIFGGHMPSKPTRNFSAICFFSLVVFLLQAFPSRAQVSNPPTTAEREILSKLDADRTGKEIQRLSVGIVDNDSGAGAGTAVAGSADEKKIADAVAEEMKAIGLDVHTEPFPVRHYEYGKVSLKVNGVSIEAIS